MADKSYKLTFELSDGSSKDVQFTAPQGEAATLEIAGMTMLASGAEPTVIEKIDSTAQARKYTIGIPASKSAYEYAQDGGYTGTEEEFAEKLAKRYPYISVKDYGAVGDGSTDDTTAFQNALTEKRVVYVPGGTYILSDTLVIEANCCLELSQDTVLKFTQTDANGITLLRLAHLKGNHATIFVPYDFSANVINCDGGEDYARLDPDNLADSNTTAVPPFKKWDPQWKMSRYVTDINICKVNDSGFHYSNEGDCYGTAVYLHCNKDDWPANYMWGVSMSGVRIAGGFNYGIRIYNIGDSEVSWDHDMRIEAVIDACKIAVSVENAHYDRLAVTIQPRPAADGTAYAEHGIQLIDSRCIDLSSSRVWDWTKKNDSGNTVNSKWEKDNEFQHIAMYGDCTGLILDDFLYYAQSTYDIRDLIYTDMPGNLEKMTILQEPITRWFKPVDGVPYFSDGTYEKQLMTQENLDAYFDTDVVNGFADALATATDADGNIFNDVGYQTGVRFTSLGTGTDLTADLEYMTTGFIKVAPGSMVYCKELSFADTGKTYAGIVYYNSSKTRVASVTIGNVVNGAAYYYVINYTEETGGCSFQIASSDTLSNTGVTYVRFVFPMTGVGTNPMLAIDQEIKYTVEGFLADGVKVKGDNLLLYGPGGAAFRLLVSDDGTLTAEPVEV